ncbi:MAG: site-specific DNA-methyltransferase, partial [Candidatus Portnoybacteria bacterium CG23_combo_of_CG06-09_8_20_14_all_37_13]
MIWHKDIGTAPDNDFKRKHQVIFRYTRSKYPKFNQIKDPVFNEDRYDQIDENGRKFFIRGDTGKKCYADEGVPADDVWSYLRDDRLRELNSMSNERIGFDTQKPVYLLERIIKASSNENDLIADFFIGSGTTVAVAEKLNRRWLGCELGKVGIQVARGRMVEMKSK